MGATKFALATWFVITGNGGPLAEAMPVSENPQHPLALLEAELPTLAVVLPLVGVVVLQLPALLPQLLSASPIN